MKNQTVKISGSKIEKGMFIKVAGIEPHWKIEGLMSVELGSVKNDSPIVEVVEIEKADKETYYYNGRRVGLGSLIFKSACGKRVEISTRQKVELIS